MTKLLLLTFTLSHKSQSLMKRTEKPFPRIQLGVQLSPNEILWDPLVLPT